MYAVVGFVCLGVRYFQIKKVRKHMASHPERYERKVSIYQPHEASVAELNSEYQNSQASPANLQSRASQSQTRRPELEKLQASPPTSKASAGAD